MDRIVETACRALQGLTCSTNTEPTGSEANDSSGEETPLISGLSDDVALLCLARVPRTYHSNLKCVSKRWRNLVCGEEWRNIRKKYDLEETWIYVLCREYDEKWGMPKYSCYVLDPYASTRCWKRIRDLPPCIVKRQYMHFEVLGRKAYLIGGRDITQRQWDLCDWDEDLDHMTDEVHCYDSQTNSWSKAAPLSTPRCLFASEVLDGKIYAVGSEVNPVGTSTWEAYEPIKNIWTAHSYPQLIDYSTDSVVHNGKLYVSNATYVVPQSDARGVVYEPSTSTWHDADTDLVLGWSHATVVADGRLYSLDTELNLWMWEEIRKKWVLVGKMSPFLEISSYRVVAIGKSIFFIGKGLKTTELDVSNARNKRGELWIGDVTGPITISDLRPDTCKCMTI